jgi:hypothetical protein
LGSLQDVLSEAEKRDVITFFIGRSSRCPEANIDYPRRAICPIREVNQSKAPHSGRIVAGAGAGNQGKNPAASGNVSEVATLLDLS